MVGLQAHRHAPRQADGVAEARDDLDTCCAARIRSWLRMILETAATISGVSPGASRASTSVVAASDSSQSRNSPTVMCDDRREGRGIVAVDDEPGDVVVLVGDQRLVEEALQRHVGQRHLGGDVLLGARRRDAGEHVAGARRRRLGHQLLQVRRTDRTVCRHAAWYTGPLLSDALDAA